MTPSMRHAEEPITLIVGVSPTGVGATIAHRLAGEHHHLVLGSRRTKQLGGLQQTLMEKAGSVRLLRCDATRPRHVRHLIDDILVHYGRLDNFVFTPGRPITGPFLETPIEALDVQFQENVRAPWLWMQSIIPVMQEHGGGTLVLLSAASGHEGAPHLSAYSASKHALHGLVESVASEFQQELIKPVALVIDGELERSGKAEEPPLGEQSAPQISLDQVAEAVSTIINQDALAIGTQYWLTPQT
jgi:NAD(P)-dependent dehydrogenase (short-subunit alcohol dehydrogenase family)